MDYYLSQDLTHKCVREKSYTVEILSCLQKHFMILDSDMLTGKEKSKISLHFKSGNQNNEIVKK